MPSTVFVAGTDNIIQRPRYWRQKHRRPSTVVFGALVTIMVMFVW